MSQALVDEEANIPNTFTCRDAHKKPTEFEASDSTRNDATLHASQTAYVEN